MSVMTKEDFKKAVEDACPPEMLDEELNRLDKFYESYLGITQICDDVGPVCTNDEKTGKPKLVIGTGSAYKR